MKKLKNLADAANFLPLPARFPLPQGPNYTLIFPTPPVPYPQVYFKPGAGNQIKLTAPEGQNIGRIIEYYIFCAVGTKHFTGMFTQKLNLPYLWHGELCILHYLPPIFSA